MSYIGIRSLPWAMLSFVYLQSSPTYVNVLCLEYKNNLRMTVLAQTKSLSNLMSCLWWWPGAIGSLWTFRIMGTVEFLLVRCSFLWCKENLSLLRGLSNSMYLFFTLKGVEKYTKLREQRVALAYKIHFSFLMRVLPLIPWISSLHIQLALYHSQRSWTSNC